MEHTDLKNIKDRVLYWHHEDVIVIDCEGIKVTSECFVHVKILDNEFNELFSHNATNKQFIEFKKIMNDNKYAILYKDDPVFGKAALIKMYYKDRIPCGVNYNAVKYEQLLNDYNELDLN